MCGLLNPVENRGFEDQELSFRESFWPLVFVLIAIANPPWQCRLGMKVSKLDHSHSNADVTYQ
jgi:hypothetical protein